MERRQRIPGKHTAAAESGVNPLRLGGKIILILPEHFRHSSYTLRRVSVKGGKPRHQFRADIVPRIDGIRICRIDSV